MAVVSMTVTRCSDDLNMQVNTCQSEVRNTLDIGNEIQLLIDRYAERGIPGIAVAVQKGNEVWEGSAGYAQIESAEKLNPCHLMYAQSIAKLYAATLTMRLKEEGKLNLDYPISTYLPQSISSRITNSSAITVRMLLNHTAGVYEYTDDLKFVTTLLNNKDKNLSSDYFLSFILDKPSAFEPGSKYRYTNSNYLLLSLVAEFVTQKPHHVLFREYLFEPLGLSHSYYTKELWQQRMAIPNTYWDYFSNGFIENISTTQLNYVAACLGDDEMVGRASDYVHFLRALVKGKVVSASSFQEMQTWVNDSDGEPVYGLGLEKISFQNTAGFGHGGEGFGAGAVLYHFPEKDLTYYLGVNVSLLLDSPAKEQTSLLLDELNELVLK